MVSIDARRNALMPSARLGPWAEIAQETILMDFGNFCNQHPEIVRLARDPAQGTFQWWALETCPTRVEIFLCQHGQVEGTNSLIRI